MTGRRAAADERFMRLALTLGERGRGRTAPNPVVGAVLVRGGRVLCRGHHRGAGLDHAEIAALRRVGFRAPGATLYVTLEPCCHQGRTGPCTEAIIDAGVRRVVVGCRDPNPLVDGRGIAALRRTGLEVDVGCLEAECRKANRAFFVWIGQGRPLVTLKAAATLDRFISARRTSPTSITGPAARRAARRMRAEHDAVLVGAGTVRADDPRLTVRLPGMADRHPLRVVLDGRLRTPRGARVLRPAGGAHTLVLGARGASAKKVRTLERAGAEVRLLPARRGKIPVSTILRALAERGIQSVLVEGGSIVHSAFAATGFVDRVYVFFAPFRLRRGVPLSPGLLAKLAAGLVSGSPTAVVIRGDILLAADVGGDGGRRS